MLDIDENKTIHITRGDAGRISLGAKVRAGETYTFKPGDVVRFKVFTKKDCTDVKLQKDISVLEYCERVNIEFLKDDTKIDSLINKPVEYWYDVELNPDTYPQTIIGYNVEGPKIFKLYPEGGDM